MNKFLTYTVLIFFFSCNQSKLAGIYIIDKIEADTISNNYLKEIRLYNNESIHLVFRNDVLRGTWKEKEGLDYHNIGIFANGNHKEMEVYENMTHDNLIKLDFIGTPTDFRGGIYDSLSFVKVH